MSFIRQRRLFWTDPTDTDFTVIEVYAAPAGGLDPADFLASIDARDGTYSPIALVPPGAQEYSITGLPEDEYHFAIVSGDDAGNFGDPQNIPEWVAVPLDVTPPGNPTGLGIE